MTSTMKYCESCEGECQSDVMEYCECCGVGKRNGCEMNPSDESIFDGMCDECRENEEEEDRVWRLTEELYPPYYEEEEVEEVEELTQEKMKKYDMLVDACVPTAFTKDEDLVVGDIVKHSFGCRDYKLMNVTRLTEKTIWYSECWTKKYKFRDSGGDFHTYGKYQYSPMSDIGGLNYKRKRHTKVLNNYNDEKWRGQSVYKYPSCGDIWIKEEESDIWR